MDEVIAGCANQAGEDNRNVARMAALIAGLPETVPGITLNLLCASGLDAVAAAARRIACGEADLIVAGGVESMSRAPLVMPKPDAAFSRRAEIHDTTIGWRFVNEGAGAAARHRLDARDGREQSLRRTRSRARTRTPSPCARRSAALAAIASGRMAREIAPVTIPQRKGEPRVVDTDEHPRETSMEALGRLRAPFREGGSVTARQRVGRQRRGPRR